ncbi:MAG: LytR/AlgR family response regulator transcription factor [Opitutaceae bacterium]
MKKLRVLIVDDEPLARERVRLLLAKEEDVEIVGECATGAEAIASARESKPGVMLLDIQMPEIDGFGVLRELGPELPVVIFVTAFDEHAVKAFEVHALDYLLKPFKPARLRQALDRARRQLAGPDGGGTAVDRILALLSEQREQAAQSWLTRISVRSGDRVRFVNVEDVDWIEASGNYVVVHAGKEKHTIRITLGALEARLSPKQFQRLSRSAVVNLDRIKEIQPLFHGEHVAILKDGTRIPMTRGVRELQERMKFL